MKNPLEKMPDQARLWIYQADRAFTPAEEEGLESLLTRFTQQWAAHGQQLAATFAIEYHQFIIIAVDESLSGASGCSIDASVHLMQEIERKLGVSLLDRTKVAFLQENSLRFTNVGQIKSAIESGEIRPDTAVFNNLVENVGDWREKWVSPAEQTWMGRYFK